MAEIAKNLLKLLDPERIDQNLFRAGNEDPSRRRVFGGQVLGQALIAAARTVEGRVAHSLHAYFLRPGDPSANIIYDVERIRDGGSFTTRRVVAIQHGQPIFSMSASFQVEEPGLEHSDEMPKVPAPEELESELDYHRRLAPRVHEKVREAFIRERPIEIRPVQQLDVVSPEPMPPERAFWIRARTELPDDTLIHQALFAYASDMHLLAAALLPHAVSYLTRNLQLASIDHALWFHRPFRMDEWLLYVTDAPSAGGSRGFTRGSLFNRAGVRVASVAQEGLMRMRERNPA